MLTPTCRGSGSPEKAKFLCWSCELLFAVFECPGRCKNAWADAGMPEGMPRQMQGCPGEPVPVEELKLSPVSKPCVGLALVMPIPEAELAARSTCPVPAACV